MQGLQGVGRRPCPLASQNSRACLLYGFSSLTPSILSYHSLAQDISWPSHCPFFPFRLRLDDGLSTQGPKLVENCSTSTFEITLCKKDAIISAVQSRIIQQRQVCPANTVSFSDRINHHDLTDNIVRFPPRTFPKTYYPIMVESLVATRMINLLDDGAANPLENFMPPQ